MCQCEACRERIPLICAALKRQALPLTARAIANELSEQKSSINHTLYANVEMFEPQPGYLWNLVGIHDGEVGRPKLFAWQEEAIDAWRASGLRGIVEAVTGAGKTRVALEVIADFLKQPKARAVVLVPTTSLLRQWKTALTNRLSESVGECGGGALDNMLNYRATVYLVHAAIHYLQTEVTAAATQGPVLLVADECHRYGAPSWATALNGPYAATLGLSATPKRVYDSGFEESVEPSLGPVVYRLGYERALADGVIAPFEVARVALPLTVKERLAYETQSKEIKRLSDRLMSEHGIRRVDVLPTAQQLAKTEDPLGLAYLSKVQARVADLHRCESRAKFIRWVVSEALRDISETSMVFAHDISTCDFIANVLLEWGIAAEAIHSETAGTTVNEALDRFRAGETKVLVAAKKLDEGIDVPDASVAILCSQMTVDRVMKQRLGRILRKGVQKTRARCVVLFVPDTREDPGRYDDDDPALFHNQIASLGRLYDFAWPDDSHEILDWLREE